MAEMTPEQGLYMSFPDLHSAASQYRGHAGALNGHADLLAGAGVPAAAFGASAGAGAEYDQVRTAMESSVRSHAAHVAGHGTHVMTFAGQQQGTDASGAADVYSIVADV